MIHMRVYFHLLQVSNKLIQHSEFRATLIGGETEIWHGSIQVYASQSYEANSKSNYRNQIPVDSNIVSHTSTNEYVILT